MPLTRDERAIISTTIADLQRLLDNDHGQQDRDTEAAPNGPRPISILRTSATTGSAEWYAENRRCWSFLDAVAAIGKPIPPREISRLALANGYDPRAVNGFYRGDGCLRRTGDRGALREITETGLSWLRDNEAEFGPGAQPSAR